MKINDLSAGLSSAGRADSVIVTAKGARENGSSAIVTEHFVDLFVNAQLVAKLVCTPSDLPEMIIGRLITEGIIKTTDDVESLYVCDSGRTVKVFLEKDIELRSFVENEPTCCTGNKVFLENAVAHKLNKLVKSDWKPEWIFNLANEFANGSKIHKATKGTHSCYLSVNGEVVYASEDIGRHNALDKAIGFVAMKGYAPRECVLFTTGRVPTDMVEKAIAAGVPVLVSKAVPTDVAIEMAREYNLTLICKAWPDKFEIFNEAQ